MPLLLGGDIVLAVQGVGLDGAAAREVIRGRVADLGEADEVEVTVLRAGKQLVLRGRWGDVR